MAVREIIDGVDSMVLLALLEGAPVGSCQLMRPGAEDGAYFGMFAVRPGLQGSGFGAALLAEAERTARAEWGSRTMRMTVIRQREELIAWYRRRGYELTGEREPFPYGDERYGIPLRDDLEFVVLEKRIG
jgi:ribosomal protein S18 acetylase RimI-like enzyme